MSQHPTPHPPAPTDFQTRLLTRLDEIIGLLETLTTILVDRDDEDAFFLPDPAMLLGMDDDEVPY